MAIFKRGDVYWVDVCAPGHSRVRFTSRTGDRKEALAFERRIRTAIEQGTYRSVSGAGPTTLRGALEAVMRTEWRHQKSARTHASNIEVLCSLLGELSPITSITEERVRLMKERMRAAGAAPATINRKLAALSKTLRYFNVPVPAACKAEKENNGRVRWLTQHEENELMRKCDPEYAPLFSFMLKTGMRLSEALTLKHEQVDPQAQQVTLWETKGGRPRTIALTRSAFAIVMPTGAQTVGPFAHLTASGAERAWSRVRTAMGLTNDREFVIHALRHTFATRLVRLGARIEVVQKLLGHASITQTMRYAHLGESQLREAIDLLDESAEVVGV